MPRAIKRYNVSGRSSHKNKIGGGEIQQKSATNFIKARIQRAGVQRSPSKATQGNLEEPFTLCQIQTLCLIHTTGRSALKQPRTLNQDCTSNPSEDQLFGFSSSFHRNSPVLLAERKWLLLRFIHEPLQCD